MQGRVQIFLAWVQVNLVDAISGGGVPRSSSAEGECLHCALSVIMNVTHHNAAGCNQASSEPKFQAVQYLERRTIRV